MRRRALSFVAGACSGLIGLAHAAAQAPPAAGAAPAQLRQVAYLKASNPGMGDHFGEGGPLAGHTLQSTAISSDGNTIAIGAPHESSAAKGINGNQNDESAYSSGAVYVYTRNGATLAQQAYVKASNTGANDHFGNVVALSADGNTMAVAAREEGSAAKSVNGNQADDSIPGAGAVYVFTRTGNAWTQQAYIKASNTGKPGVGDIPAEGDEFGFSMALSRDGNTIAVGAIGEDSNAHGINGNQADDSAGGSGAVYVFMRTGSTWSQQAYIKSEAGASGGLFGHSVALNANGNTLAVGHYDENGSARAANGPVDNGRGGSGAAWIYSRTGNTWSREGYLKAWNSDPRDAWGTAVALSDDGNTAVVTSSDDDCLCPVILHAPSTLGTSDQATNMSAGAAAVFVRSGGMWTQQAFIKASNVGREDWFGSALGLSGDGNTLAVAAGSEDSSGRGVNGRQDDDLATDAGAVYFFTRTGTMWAQQAYVKGSNTDAFDEFGTSVALSRDGRTMVVGARGEDSNARGINGNQNDNSLDEAGAAYVFTR
jgi:hypothetical protein